MKNTLRNIVVLTRLNRPVGIWLLLWPTLIGLWIAALGQPDLSLIVIFILGTVLARSAGCVVNDIADRNFDGKVARTRNRPIPKGEVSVRQALVLAGICAISGLALVSFSLNLVILALVGGGIACAYPFFKRWTNYPQAVLGIAFSWGIVMAWEAGRGDWTSVVPLLLVFGNWCWVMIYDTYYALTDRQDDIGMGLGSTAIAWQGRERVFLLPAAVAVIACWTAVGVLANLGVIWYLGVGFALYSFYRQDSLIFGQRATEATQSQKPRDETALTHKAFLANANAGAVLFCSLLLDYELTYWLRFNG